jgi:hypothetical protein
MSDYDLESIKRRIIAGLYGGDIIALYSLKSSNPNIDWKPMGFIETSPEMVQKAVKELINEDLIKTFEKEDKIIYHLSFSNRSKVEEIWFNFIHNEVDLKLSPVLDGIAMRINIKTLIKPRWGD